MRAATAEIDATLDDLLIRWHQFSPVRVGRGFNDRTLVAGDYQISRQYDDCNGALDDAIEATILRQVGYEIEQLLPLHRIAIHMLARALVVGCEVFMSPRLPADRDERLSLIRLSRDALTVRLVASGVM